VTTSSLLVEFDRLTVIYASRKTLQVTLSLHVLEVLDISEAALTPARSGKSSKSRGFRPFGDVSVAMVYFVVPDAQLYLQHGYVPKDAYDISPLVKTVGICTHDGIVILDPTK
jgi:hypothetical protein